MIFSIFIAVLVLGIAFFHWVQGLFSSMISMALALLAATFAIGYHEAVVASLLGGKMADSANAMVLCAIFAGVYGIGRLLFDMLIPGNIRVPLYVDKVGGAACGLVAGLAAGGVFAVAAQSLPFGPAIAFQAPYAFKEDKSFSTQIPGRRSQDEVLVSGALEDEFPPPEKEAKLWIPADRAIVSFVAFQSSTGALAGGINFLDQHPDLVRELFFQRVGIEPGAKRTALNIGDRKDVDVSEIFAVQSLRQVEGELGQVRDRKLPPTRTVTGGKTLLVVRADIAASATDTDRRFRFSPGQIRLVVDGKVFYPVGTLYHPGNALVANAIDDYLVADAGGGAKIDFVFELDRADVMEGGDPKQPAAASTMKPGAFLEVKRLARVDLTDKTVSGAAPNGQSGGVLRKADVLRALGERQD